MNAGCYQGQQFRAACEGMRWSEGPSTHILQQMMQHSLARAEQLQFTALKFSTYAPLTKIGAPAVPIVNQ